jgi:hypothetical protein
VNATALRPPLKAEIEETRERCADAVRCLDGQLRVRESSAPLPAPDVRMLAASAADADRALTPIPADADSTRSDVVRRAYLAAALQSLDRLTDLPVADSVRARFCAVFRSFCEPTPADSRRYRPDLYYPPRSLAQCALLERFPAGQLDWEVSGIPRSYLWKMPIADLPRVLRAVATDLQGVRPCFTAHMGVQRYPLLFVEIESHRSYYRIAESMALQPGVKALIMASWYHSLETIRVSPHLAWTNKTPVDHGAVVTHIGEASPEDGFLVGSEQRRKLFESGKYKPTIGLVIWPRRSLLAWAAAHPEFAAESGTG